MPIGARDPKDPVSMRMPDGTAQLITWAYVMEMMKDPLQTITSEIQEQNFSLNRIDAKIVEMSNNIG